MGLLPKYPRIILFEIYYLASGGSGRETRETDGRSTHLSLSLSLLLSNFSSQSNHLYGVSTKLPSVGGMPGANRQYLEKTKCNLLHPEIMATTLNLWAGSACTRLTAKIY